MGFIIVFISVYVHVYDMGIADFTFNRSTAGISINPVEVMYIFLLSIPAVIGIANIMLANNICDIEDDIENRRYTLPIYIGKERALWVFKALYYISYADLILLIILRIVPEAAVLTLFTIIPVTGNIKGFYEKQTKKDTFVLSVKNFLLINVVLVLAIGGTIVIEGLLK